MTIHQDIVHHKHHVKGKKADAVAAGLPVEHLSEARASMGRGSSLNVSLGLLTAASVHKLKFTLDCHADPTPPVYSQKYTKNRRSRDANIGKENKAKNKKSGRISLIFPNWSCLRYMPPPTRIKPPQ